MHSHSTLGVTGHVARIAGSSREMLCSAHAGTAAAREKIALKYTPAGAIPTDGSPATCNACA